MLFSTITYTLGFVGSTDCGEEKAGGIYPTYSGFSCPCPAYILSGATFTPQMSVIFVDFRNSGNDHGVVKFL